MSKIKILENMIKRIVKEEKKKLNEVDEKEILQLVRKLKTLDSQKLNPRIDPDSSEARKIITRLQKLGVMNQDEVFIFGHPLMDEIDKIYE